jgi:nucleoside-diphosphate-sugar epimerase
MHYFFSDAIEGLILFGFHPMANNDIFNLTSSEKAVFSDAQYIEILKEQLFPDVTIKFVEHYNNHCIPSKPWILDNSKSVSFLGFTPHYSLAKGIIKCSEDILHMIKTEIA